MKTDLTYKDFTAVILAGGQNSRMGGSNKAFLEFNGGTIMERQLALLRGIFSQIMIVSRDPEIYKSFASQDCKIVADIYAYRSSMTGLHAGLYHMHTPYAFVTACDSPFVQESMVRLILNQTSPNDDWVLPSYDGHYEPLCAVYGKGCLPHLDKLLQDGKVSILELFDLVSVKYVPKNVLRAADPEFYSFINVNTPEQLVAAQHLKIHQK